jgi:hypothetical protein
MYRVLYTDLENKNINKAEYFEKLSDAISFTNKKPMVGRIIDLRFVTEKEKNHVFGI